MRKSSVDDSSTALLSDTQMHSVMLGEMIPLLGFTRYRSGAVVRI
jgi:hypothetical protein